VEDRGVDGRIILKWILEQDGGGGVRRLDRSGAGWGYVLCIR
jgi:hypothetical protein